MLVVDLPALADVASLRAVVLGSCRVREPLFALRDRGDLRIRAQGLLLTHTAEEALQSLSIGTGEMVVPDFLKPLILSGPAPRAGGALARSLRGRVDVFVVEVFDDRQFAFGEVRLNQNLVALDLVQASRGALLDWYREISRCQPAQEATVEAALEKLRARGLPAGESMGELLRGITLSRRSGAEVAATLAALTAKMGGAWVVIGPFANPGASGEMMAWRREFNATLGAAAAASGALAFDPTQLIVEHGAATVLAAGGANIYEYAEAFYPRLGETLVGLIRQAGPRRGARAPGRAADLDRARSLIAVEARVLAGFKRLRRLTRKAGRWAARRMTEPEKS